MLELSLSICIAVLLSNHIPVLQEGHWFSNYTEGMPRVIKLHFIKEEAIAL